MLILVTGGAGFIGSNLTRRLVRQGHTVRVLDDYSLGSGTGLPSTGVEIFRGSILNRDTVRDAVAGVDAVFHLAARGSVPRSVEDPNSAYCVNSSGTLELLEAVRATRVPLTFSSSSSVYGANTDLPKHERMWTQPLSPYAASKLSAESLVISYGLTYGLPVKVFRFFNVFGPWQQPNHDYAAVIPKWIWRVLNGQHIEVYGDGSQSRDFTYVDSVTEVLEASMRTKHPPSAVNLAFGRRTSLNELLDEIAVVLGVTPERQYLPPRKSDVQHSHCDPSLLRSLYPDVRPLPLRESLQVTTAWLRMERPE